MEGRLPRQLKGTRIANPLRHNKTMPYPPVIILAALGIYGAIVGVRELGHEAKAGGKQAWCLVRTLHRCPKQKPLPAQAGGGEEKSPANASNQ